ncbi:MAG: ribonuclease E/G [Lachnospiraceae bacterium]|nr:ribonuclease E/G [Lachnospiraceae bacterium]
MNKLIITRWNQLICTALAGDRKILQIRLEPDEGETLLNSIYIGKVQNIRKNINAAFVDIGGGITGYYSLMDNQNHQYVNPGAHKELRVGDEIIVQVSREAVKTKAPVLSGNLVFTGKLTVLTAGKSGVGFSNKITDRQWKNALRPVLEQEAGEGYGLIVRTNGKDASPKELLEEIRSLKKICSDIMESAPYRSCYSRLYQAPAAFLAGIRDAYADQLQEIVTDDTSLYKQIDDFLNREQPEDAGKLRLYQDDLLSLSSLYCLDKAMEDVTADRVWLKSGGYLVIEPTEALVVIDVNTGKYSGKKTMQETILKINLEAAEEIGRQLRLRNLSGIIIVDFIDMTAEEDRKQLLDHLEAVVRLDPVKTTVVDITKLNLVELTRKKIHRPLHEQLSAWRKASGNTKEKLV